MTDAFVWDAGTPEERMTNEKETWEIIQEIHHEFIKDNKAIQYSHKVTASLTFPEPIWGYILFFVGTMYVILNYHLKKQEALLHMLILSM